MIFRHLIITLGIVAATMSTAVAQQTQKLTAERHNEYGLTYSLPTTQLAVTITAVRTQKLAGPFWQYAKKYLGMDKVVTADRSSWQITEVKVVPFGTADPDSRYLMQLKPGASTYLTAAPDGMLLSINAPAEYSRPEPLFSSPAETLPDMSGYLRYVDEDFLSSQSVGKQASMLAESLLEVREARLSLLRGTADNMPADARQLELMISSLSEQEEAMTRAFEGYTSRSSWTTTIYYTPGKGGKTVVARLSDFDGFVDTDDLSGEPIYLEVKNIEHAELPEDEKGETKKLPRDAVAYVIPGMADISLSFGGRSLYSQGLEFAQYGVVFGLNPALFTDKKSPSYAIFNPATGGVAKIGPVSELAE